MTSSHVQTIQAGATFVPRALALAVIAGVIACEHETGSEPDGGRLVAREGGQVPADASEGRDDGAIEVPPPASSLDEVLAAASGAVRGTVTNLHLDALTHEVRAAGLNWRIHTDRIELSTTSSIGVGRVPQMSAYLIPVECEAFDDDWVPLPDYVLSSCTGRNEHNSPAAGEDVIALFMGTSGTPTLVFRMRVSASGEVDVSGLTEPPVDRQVNSIWLGMERRWRELGRD